MSARKVPKVGDVVDIVRAQHLPRQLGVVVCTTCETRWVDVLIGEGRLVKWPICSLRVVNNEKY